MKKKILFINGHLNAGGVEKSLVDILTHMDYCKYDVDLLLLEDLGDYAADLPEQVRVRLVDLGKTFGALPKVLLRCAKQGDWFSFAMKLLLTHSARTDVRKLRCARRLLFGSKRYDVVVGFRPGICTSIAAFVARAEKRITWWHHGEYNLNPAEERDYILACREMDHVVSVSESCAVFLQERLPEFADRVTVIPNFLSPEAIREKAGRFAPYEGDPRFHIVTVARLAPEKHMENCMYAAKILRDEGYADFLWHIVGDGAERGRLEALVSEYGVSDLIRFEGRQSNPYPYLKNADLFVHPSYVESQGIVILEAMLLGVPCVVTRSLGPCEFMVDGVNGILTQQSRESLTDNVIKMYTNRELYMTIKANTRCADQFLPSAVMEQISRLLEE